MFRKNEGISFALLACALVIAGCFAIPNAREPGPEFKAAQASEVLSVVTYNKTLSVADTEYSQALPAGCKYFSIKGRAGETAVIRFAFVTGKVATPTAPYASLSAGSSYSSPEKYSAGGDTIYLASATAGAVVEIVAYAPN